MKIVGIYCKCPSGHVEKITDETKLFKLCQQYGRHCYRIDDLMFVCKVMSRNGYKYKPILV